MNPLSALRTLANPAFRAEAARAPAEIAPPQTIPFTELEKLPPGLLPLNPPGPGPAPVSFESALSGLVRDVAVKQAAAGHAVQDLLGGQNVSLHQTMIAMEEASVSFQLMVEVRNKLLESYQELMRMQI